MELNLDLVRAQAREEYRAESMRIAVNAEKARLRAQPQKSFWQRLTSKLPFTIHIERKTS
jgi:hypothetical protein